MPYKYEKIALAFEEIMQAQRDSRNVDTSIESLHRTRRQKLLDMWSEDIGRELAEDEALKLTNAHMAVIYSLRDHFLEHGYAETGRELGDMLDARFANAGGHKYLRTLFPNGPVAQGTQIAGLPIPNLTEN